MIATILAQNKSEKTIRGGMVVFDARNSPMSGSAPILSFYPLPPLKKFLFANLYWPKSCRKIKKPLLSLKNASLYRVKQRCVFSICCLIL